LTRFAQQNGYTNELGRYFMRTQPRYWGLVSKARDAVRKVQARSRTGSLEVMPIAAPLPSRRSTTEQWDRVAAILLEAQSRARRAQDHQHSAARQIDAATYALQRLREEVAPALHFTVPRSPRPPLEPGSFRREEFRRSEPLAA
jgi:hypothetical protein